MVKIQQEKSTEKEMTAEKNEIVNNQVWGRQQVMLSSLLFDGNQQAFQDFQKVESQGFGKRDRHSAAFLFDYGA